MKNFKSILSIVVGLSALGCLSWQRSGAVDVCKRNKDACTKSADMCQADYDACMDNALKEDEETFLSDVQPESEDLYDDFTSQQRKQAMDYADGNKMSPDEAIAKVARLNPLNN
jgi:hypothetical protein